MYIKALAFVISTKYQINVWFFVFNLRYNMRNMTKISHYARFFIGVALLCAFMFLLAAGLFLVLPKNLSNTQYMPPDDTGSKEAEIKKPEDDVAQAPNTENTQEQSMVNMTDIADVLRRARETIEQFEYTPQMEDYSAINERAREALVNILCTSRQNDSRAISGSGVVIDSRGIILTNAHIGQYFLLEKYKPYNLDCVIRTGSPAKIQYDAELMYISPSWIQENAEMITKDAPTGTGEDDFALLFINKEFGADMEASPTLSFVQPDITENFIQKNAPVVLASYPAGFLGFINIQKDLYKASAFSAIQEIYTFNEGTSDLISVGGSIVAQGGSSGSGVVSIPDQKLIGIIVTSSDAESTDDRNLNAITLSHINRSIQKDLNITFNDFLLENPTKRSQDFNANTAPALFNLLVSEIEKH